MTYKRLLAVPVLLLATVLTACSSAATKKGASAPANGDAVTVQSGTYIRPDETSAPAKEHGYLALKVRVKNNGSKQDVMDDDFTLRDSKNNKIKSQSVYGEGNEFSTIDDEKLSHGGSMKGYVVFDVKKGEKYTLVMSPMATSGKDVPETKVAITTNKYKDKTQEAQQALDAYVSQVFLNKTSVNYDKLVANDVKTEKQQYQSDARKFLEDAFDNSIEDSASNKMIADIQTVNAKKAKATYTVKSVTPTSATITMTPIVLKLTELSDLISRVQDGIQDEVDSTQDADDTDTADVTGDDVSDSAKEAVYEKFPQLLDKLPVRQADDEDVTLVKVGNKWKVNSSDDDFKTVRQDYTGESY